MKTLDLRALDMRLDGPSLSDEFIRQVLGHPKTGAVAIANAAQAAALLEADRDCLPTDIRTERLLQLLERALPYVIDAHQGRGDSELQKAIREELHS